MVESVVAVDDVIVDAFDDVIDAVDVDDDVSEVAATPEARVIR